MKKLIMCMFIFISIFTGCTTVKTYNSEISYETEAIPATDAITKTVNNITTKINGDYIIGTAPKDYSSGKEKEFTTSQSGNYVAGEDFPVGVYDLVPVSGNGTVQGASLNEMMGVDGGEFYTSYYDNKEFKEGNTLTVSGVALKLVPQKQDTFYIPAGTYNITAIEGNGTVQGSGLNEMMGVDGSNFYVTNYDNAKLNEGATLNISGVSLELEPKEKKVIVKEAMPAIPSQTITETYEITNEENAIPICTSNDKEVECTKLEKYDELVKDIQEQMKENE